MIYSNKNNVTLIKVIVLGIINCNTTKVIVTCPFYFIDFYVTNIL